MALFFGPPSTHNTAYAILLS